MRKIFPCLGEQDHAWSFGWDGRAGGAGGMIFEGFAMAHWYDINLIC